MDGQGQARDRPRARMIVLAALAALAGTAVLEAREATAAADVLRSGLFVAAAVIAALGARCGGNRAWWLLAGGLASYALAWILWHSLADDVFRFPTVPDAPWLAAYVGVLGAVLRAHPDGAGRLRALHLDGAILGAAVAVLSWIYVMEPALGTADPAAVATEGAALYLFLDVIVLAMLASIWVGGGGALPPSHRWLALGVALWGAADIPYAVSVAGAIPWNGGAMDLCWVAGALCMAAAPWASRGRWAPCPRRRANEWIPGLAALAAVLLALIEGPGPVATALVGAVMLATVLRLGARAREADRLLEHARASERELAQAQERYRTILEAASDGILVTDLAGRATFANARMAEIAGVERTALLGGTLRDLLADEEGLDDEQGDLRLRRPDGVEAWVDVSTIRLGGADGAGIGAVQTVTDVSVRRRAEDVVRRSQQLLAAAERIAGVGSWETLGRASDDILWSPELYRVMGRDPETFSPTVTATFALIAPEDRQRVRGLLEHALATGAAVSATYRMRRADGRLRTILAYAERLTGADGHRLIGTAQDVTDRDAAERALERSEQRYRQIVETAAEGVWALDAAGRTTFANRRMAQLLGVGADELLGRSFEEFVAPDDRAILRRLLGEELTNLDVELRRADGSAVDGLVSASPLTAPDGEPGGALVMVADITERVAAEQENERLQTMLFQAQKLETVGQLAGGIAHDFNNVLAIIRNYADFALAELAGHPAEADVREVRHAAQRAGALTRQLLVFSRQETVRPEPLALNDAIVETLGMLRRSVGTHVTLVDALADDLPPVMADRGQVEQVLVNLAVNAGDAMPDGGTLTIATELVELHRGDPALHPGAEPGPHVRLVVADTGEGMAPEVAGRAFDPFFTTKPQGSGTGLGLATVYGIVSRGVGTVALDSRPGEGTAVVVHLPAVAAAVRPPADPAVPELPPGEGRSILLVEDETAMREVTRRILAGHGYRVVDAHDGPTGLRLGGDLREPLDLVVTDVVLPGFSGTTLADRLRARRPGLPVLFMSGYTERPDLPLDPATFLPKPFGAEELLERVGTLLAAREVAS